MVSLSVATGLAVVLMAIVGHQIEGHTYHTGECPAVQPMEGFDMRQVGKCSIKSLASCNIPKNFKTKICFKLFFNNKSEVVSRCRGQLPASSLSTVP